MKHLLFFVIIAVLGTTIYVVERYKPAAPVSLNPLFQVVGDAQRQSEKLPLTVTRVSDLDEDDIGRNIARHHHIGERNIRGEETIEAYLNQVGNRLASHRLRQGIIYRLYLVGGDNAFALPGGHIAIGRDLLRLMESEDELAAVIGHEMAHVDLRHCIERLQYELAAHKAGLDLIYIVTSIPLALFHAGYSKNKEIDADRIGLQYAVAEGYSPRGAINLFRRIREKYEGKRVEKPSPKGDVIAVLADIPIAYFRSHPPFHARLAAIEREIQLQGWQLIPVKPLKTLP